MQLNLKQLQTYFEQQTLKLVKLYIMAHKNGTFLKYSNIISL